MREGESRERERERVGDREKNERESISFYELEADGGCLFKSFCSVLPHFFM